MVSAEWSVFAWNSREPLSGSTTSTPSHLPKNGQSKLSPFDLITKKAVFRD
jgi:hypothetical protein